MQFQVFLMVKVLSLSPAFLLRPKRIGAVEVITHTRMMNGYIHCAADSQKVDSLAKVLQTFVRSGSLAWHQHSHIQSFIFCAF